MKKESNTAAANWQALQRRLDCKKAANWDFAGLFDGCGLLTSIMSLRGAKRRGNLPVLPDETIAVKIEVSANNVPCFEHFCYPTLYREIATSLRSSQ